MKLKNIIKNQSVSAGKATIKGTDVTVDLVLKKLSEGVSVEQLQAQYPQLTEGLILEAIAFAANELEKVEADDDLRAWTESFINEYRPALEALAK